MGSGYASSGTRPTSAADSRGVPDDPHQQRPGSPRDRRSTARCSVPTSGASSPGTAAAPSRGLCPAHEDAKRSLSVSITDGGTVLLKCHAGCNTKAVVESLDLNMVDLFPDTGTTRGNGVKTLGTIVKTYDYQDETGQLLFQVVRFEPKDFRQRTPDGNGWSWKLNGVQRVLYRLPAIVAAPLDQAVFVVEGEKDVQRLELEDQLATTCPGGAGKWRSEYNAVLTGRPVVILPDNDEPGRQHAQHAGQSLRGIAASVKIVELPGLPRRVTYRTGWTTAATRGNCRS